MRSAALFLAGLIATSGAVAQCKPADIGVDKLRARIEGAYIYISGRLINNCSQATGAQIKVVLYDKDENILDVNDSWPASINNIPAKSDFPFQTMMDRRKGFKQFEIRVIDTKVWRQR